MMWRQKSYNKLDSMTQVAAKVENCERQYNSFNQVVDFNDAKDVFNFPSLWKGDPSMAPVNLGYSESAQTLKSALIDLTQETNTSVFTGDLQTLSKQTLVIKLSYRKIFFLVIIHAN